ncbi:MAG: hypothetical protein AAF220_07690 [Pseudomonadota bacterium]
MLVSPLQNLINLAPSIPKSRAADQVPFVERKIARFSSTSSGATGDRADEL